MSALVKCTGCAATLSVGSRNHAAEQGWVFIDVLAKGKNRYHVYCAECRPSWTKLALGEEPKKAKVKDGEEKG